jgi:hypothetical protein
MARHALKKERWTITFDHDLKSRVQEEAQKLRVYPVQLLEALVREKLNPYGFQSLKDSVAYVNSVRAGSAKRTDQAFLTDLKRWHKK